MHIGQKGNWADVVRGVRTESSRMQDSLTWKIERAKRALQRRNVCTETTPRTAVLYLENVRSGTIGPIRQTLREYLPTCTLPGLSFVGGSVMEVFENERLAQRIIETLKMMGMTHVPSFDIYGSTRVESREAKNCKLNERRIVECVVSRMKANMGGTQNSHARKWYGDTLQEAERRLQQHPNNKPDTLMGSLDEVSDITEEERLRKRTPPRISGETVGNGEDAETAPPVCKEDVTITEEPASETVRNSHEKRSTQRTSETINRETNNQ